MYDFGELLQHLRIERGYTQAQLAKKLNKSKSAICRYESNQRPPSLGTLIDIASLFNVSLDYLTGLEKGRVIAINDLSPQQISIINALLVEYRNKKSYPKSGLTDRQLAIMNELIIEFQSLPKK